MVHRHGRTLFAFALAPCKPLSCRIEASVIVLDEVPIELLRKIQGDTEMWSEGISDADVQACWRRLGTKIRARFFRQVLKLTGTAKLERAQITKAGILELLGKGIPKSWADFFFLFFLVSSFVDFLFCFLTASGLGPSKVESTPQQAISTLTMAVYLGVAIIKHSRSPWCVAC
jgi:hypothetical protein